MKLFKLILLCLFLFSKAHANTIYELIKIPNLEVYNIKTENKLRYLYAKQPFTIGVDNNINCFKSSNPLNKFKVLGAFLCITLKKNFALRFSAITLDIPKKYRNSTPPS